MYDFLKGKKLLVLGASESEIDIIRRAQSFGVHVTVTDYNKDWSKSPSKYVADEVWDISWGDLDILEKKCLENKIDGLLAGYSEIRVDNLIKLCKRLGFPCYSNEEQLEITRNKDIFKKTCIKYGVPVIKEYSSPEEVDEFPVIVKPVDRGGSIGISVANNKEELKKAYDYAMETSLCKKVIIEKYIKNGNKVNYTYAIRNGEIKLTSTCDTLTSKLHGDLTVIQNAWLYPQKQQEEALKKVDGNLRAMISGIGIKYGTIFFSSFVDENANSLFFECGFRLSGSNKHAYLYRLGNVNYLDIYILHALTGTTDGIEVNPNPEPNLKCVTLNYYAKAGKVSQIKGFEEIKALPDCVLADTFVKIGDVCKDDKAILSKICRFSFCNESPEALAADVSFANKQLQVSDERGNDMIYDRIDSNVIKKWWDAN